MEPVIDRLSKDDLGVVQTKHFYNNTEWKSSNDVELQGLGKPVSDKWMGTESDRKDMRMLGRVQVLRRNFSFVPMLGFGAVLICTWEIVFAPYFVPVSNLLFALTNGGTGGLFWGFTVTIVASIFIYLSISEMASMSPTAGGQYHWVSEFAPRSCQKYLSYITGWLLATGWQGSVVGLSFIAGTIIQGLISLNNANYAAQQWHGTLLVIAVILFAIIFNTGLAQKLPLIEGLFLLIHIVGLFAIVIPLWVLAPRNTAQVALLELSNGGNWPTMGVAFMVGLLTSLGSMLGFDCAVHMLKWSNMNRRATAEELKDASETLPRTILWGVVLNAILGYITVSTLCFTITSSSTLLTSATGYPFIQHFYNVTNSYAGTDVMVALVIITLVSAVICEIATASRQIWSFARDDGLPFSSWLSKVSPGWNIPLNAVLVSFLSGVAIALINLGSSVALNAIVSLTVSALLSSYLLSIGSFFLRRFRKEPMPEARFSLGRYGMAINIVSLVFLISFFIFCFFPTAQPVNAKTMNWNCVMFGSITLFATSYYIIIGRHKYRPPVNIQNRNL